MLPRTQRAMDLALYTTKLVEAYEEMIENNKKKLEEARDLQRQANQLLYEAQKKDLEDLKGSSIS